jgi:hypothetical protein
MSGFFTPALPASPHQQHKPLFLLTGNRWLHQQVHILRTSAKVALASQGWRSNQTNDKSRNTDKGET